MNEQGTELAILAQQANGVATQISSIKSNMARISEENKTFAENIIIKGNELLTKIEKNGMTDDLDNEISFYIKEVKVASKNMNENRKGVTQALDLVKKFFTSIENEISVKNEDGIPFKLQKARDEYARNKLEEERKKEEERQRIAAIEQSKVRLASDVKTECYRCLSIAQTNAINLLGGVFSKLTLDNQDETKKYVMGLEETFNLADHIADYQSSDIYIIGIVESKQIINDAYMQVRSEIEKAYIDTIRKAKGEVLLKWDSKIAELKASYEAEQERIKRQKQAEEEERKAQEAKNEEERRIAIEKARMLEEEARLIAEADAIRKKEIEESDNRAFEDQQKAIAEETNARLKNQELENSINEASALFESFEEAPTVKAKVTMAIKVNNRNGWIDIMKEWLTWCSRDLTNEELEKKLSFAKKDCEKLFNKNDYTIKSNNIEYVEVVTAK